jgi:two-component system, LytTR family, response regulator LytT
MKKILIIEDEELAVQRLGEMLHRIDPAAQIAGTTTSIQSSVEWLKKNPFPDLILMDIELSDGQSFEIFNHIEINVPVIFTTSYDDFAIKAFKVNSIDYLLKPVEEEDLKSALEKYDRLKLSFSEKPLLSEDINKLVQELKNQLLITGMRDRFLVKQGLQYISVETSDIAYFFAEGRLSFFVTWKNQKYVVDYTLDELELMLDSRQFYRANRAYMIHIKSISQIHNYFNGRLKLDLKPAPGGEGVTISREKAGEFKKWMGK